MPGYLSTHIKYLILVKVGTENMRVYVLRRLSTYSSDSFCFYVVSFFDNANPEFIGIVGGLSAYSNEVLGSVFNKDPKFFGNLPRLDKNVFIASGTG